MAADRRGESIDSRQLVGGELNGVGGDVFLKPGDALCSRNRHDVSTFRQHPGQRNLSGGGADVGGDVTQLVRALQVVPEVFVEEARVGLAVVAVGKLPVGADCAGEKSAAQR